MLEIYTQKTLETGNFVIETRRHSLSSWCSYVKASMRRIPASGRSVLRDGAASAGRSRPEAEPVPRVPGTPRVGDRGDAERGFGPGRRHRLPAGILVSPARRTFRGHGRVLPGGDRPAPWNGEPPGRHGRRGAFAGGISDCAQSGLSIQGIWSLGSALETGLFAIDGPRTERPGDEADRKRATSTRTLGRFSAQGTPEGKVWSEAEELLSSARSLAGSKRRQERRLGGALRRFPRTRVPDASLFGRPRRQLQQYSAVAAKSCIPGHEYLRAVE